MTIPTDQLADIGRIIVGYSAVESGMAGSFGAIRMEATRRRARQDLPYSQAERDAYDQLDFTLPGDFRGQVKRWRGLMRVFCLPAEISAVDDFVASLLEAAKVRNGLAHGNPSVSQWAPDCIRITTDTDRSRFATALEKVFRTIRQGEERTRRNLARMARYHQQHIERSISFDELRTTANFLSSAQQTMGELSSTGPYGGRRATPPGTPPLPSRR